MRMDGRKGIHVDNSVNKTAAQYDPTHENDEMKYIHPAPTREVLRVPIQFPLVTAPYTFLSSTSNPLGFLDPYTQLKNQSTIRTPATLIASKFLGKDLLTGDMRPTSIICTSIRAAASPLVLRVSSISWANAANAVRTVLDDTWFAESPGGEMLPVDGTMTMIFLVTDEVVYLCLLAASALERSELGTKDAGSGSERTGSSCVMMESGVLSAI